MRRALVAAGALALAVCAAFPAPAAAEHEGSGYIAFPLDVDILFPADGSAFRDGNITAVIDASGDSVAFFSDDFTAGTLVNATRDASGVVPNASSPSAESYYRSPEIALPRVSPAIEWSGSLEYVTSGSAANLSALYLIQVRFGDLTPGRNWSAWFNATVDGDYTGELGDQAAALRSMGSLQYQITFLQPTNASNPHLSQMQVWFIGHVERLEARLASSATWMTVANDEGRYNFSMELPEGPSTLEARATDALGGVKIARVNVSRDNTPPTIASAPAQGASIPPDEVAEIKFDGPMDRASALGVIVIKSDFPVDAVWTADNTTLILSAQESGRRGPVTVTIGPQLKDKAGNAFGQNVSYTYEMGKPPEAQGGSTLLLVAVAGIVGMAAIAVLFMMGRAKKQREAHAQSVRAELDASKAPKARQP